MSRLVVIPLLLMSLLTKAHSLAFSKLSGFNGKKMSHTRRFLTNLRATISPTSAPILETPGTLGLEYSQFILRNGIKVTLVRDSISEKSSCSLSVAAGAKDDPAGFAGLAHFTEHAVFLGSEKYPVENEYKKYISRFGGMSNAGTGMESTTYKFSITKNAYEGALDIFSQFFKCPLFAQTSIAREVMAVDSEDSKNRILDNRRMLQVLKDTYSPETSYVKFSTGNVRTLANGDAEKYAADTRAQMMAFHSRYYKPQNMAVAMVGPQPLNELRRMAEKMFSDIGNAVEQKQTAEVIPMTDKATVALEAMEALEAAREDAQKEGADMTSRRTIDSTFPFKYTGSVMRVRPVKDLRDMSILFPVPPTRHLYRSNPWSLLSYILVSWVNRYDCTVTTL
jgi:secreted Zn-dependent insulinase-like peptidase